MLKVSIDICQGCGRCSMICFKRAISLESGHSQIDYDKCDLCGICRDECKQGAIIQT
ncbi:DUF362 domain-containing protein [Chloroflexota bacterium]